VVACSVQSSRYYVVQRGDSLTTIAREHELSEQDLLKFNPTVDIAPGNKVYIPYEKAGRRGIIPRVVAVAKKEKFELNENAEDFRRYGLNWPLKTEHHISSPFGVRGYRFHEGIDITASRHTPVYCAQVGTVVYASNKLSGYGRMVIVDHGNHIRTVYAHLQKMSVHEGQKVRKGQLVGAVGSSGHSSGPHLHFEVRNGTKPHNPLYYLPGSTRVISSSK
jgi:lipoprotein NlpD